MLFFSKDKKNSFSPSKPTDITLPEPYFSYASYVSLYQVHLDILKKEQSLLTEKIEEITNAHYEYILANKYLKKILTTHSTVERLKITFHRYLKELISGEINEDYIKSRKKIGLIHYNINLSPEWYLGSLIRILDIFSDHLINKIKDKTKCSLLLEAIHRVLLFDSQIILKEYSEMFQYKTNEELCNAVDKTSDSSNIELVIHSKEKISQTVEILKGLQSSLDSSIKKMQVTRGNFSTIVSSTEDSLSKILETKDKIFHTIQNIENFSSSYSEILKNWEKLNKEIDKIKNVISIIEDIAERTNLLSLNASIEAARAGKEGAGFAVVSSEINKLSIQTSESVQSITSLVKSLVKELQAIDSQTTSYGSKLNESINLAVNSIKELEKSLDYISESSKKFFESLIDFDKIQEEYSQQNTGILEMINISNQLVSDIENNAKLLFTFTEKINNLRKDNINKITNPPFSVMIRTVKTEHLLWKWLLVSFMFDVNQLSEEQVVDHTQCRLGKWYYSIKNSKVGNLSSFKKLEQPHIELHKLAKSIYHHIKNKDLYTAKKEIQELEILSKEIVKYLNELEKDAQDLI